MPDSSASDKPQPLPPNGAEFVGMGLTILPLGHYSASVAEPRTQQRPSGSRARLLGTGVFGLLVATITAVFSTQIILQAWATPPEQGSASCREGLRELLHKLDQARQSAAVETGELNALAAFRREISGGWPLPAGLEQSCSADTEAVRLLTELDSLRYAEEHAVRYASRELAVQRRSVAALAKSVLGEP